MRNVSGNRLGIVLVLALLATCPAWAKSPKAPKAAGKGRLSFREAKKQCLKEDASRKGKALQKCIKEKRAASKAAKKSLPGA